MVHAILAKMRRPQHHGILVALAIGFPLLAPRAALAEDPAAATLIEQGLDLRQSQHDVEALALFEKAQAIAPSPRGQAQVALAQQALGRWVLAEQNLASAIAVSGDAWIESRRPILERAMTVIRAHLGDVEIVGAKEGAVYVDGARVDAPDALTHLRLEVGRRAFELRAAGYYPFSRVLDVLPGEVVRVEVEQHALLDDGKQAAVNPGPALVPTPIATKADSGRTQRTIGWVVVGGAALFLATGAIGLIERESDAQDFNANCSKNPNSSACNDLYHEGNTAQTVGIIGFVGAGVFGAVSVTLLVTAPSAKSKTTTPVVSFGCAPAWNGGASCAWRGTF